MDSIDPQVAGLPLWVGFASFTDLRTCGTRLVEMTPLTLVASGMAQVIEMRHRDVGQGLETRIPVDSVHPFTQLLGRSATRSAVQGVQLSQQQGILPCVVALKTSHRALTAPYLPGLAVLCHQSGAYLGVRGKDAGSVSSGEHS